MNYSIIGINGLPGAGKSKLIKRLLSLEEFSSWKGISTGDILRKDHARLWKDGLFGGNFQRYLASLTDKDIREFNAKIRCMTDKGQWVMDSRYVIENCRSRTDTAYVFLTAPLEVRVHRKVQESEGKLSPHEVQRDLLGREAWELTTGKRLYNYDYRVTKDYHLVLDTSKMGINAEAKAILSLVNRNL